MALHFSSPSRVTRFTSAFLTVAIVAMPFRHVYAGDILRGGGVAGPARQPGVPSAGSEVKTEAGAIGRDSLARTTQAIQAVKAMQEAARAAAISGPNNLGINPRQPSVQLPNVPNGLTSGGLQVAPGNDSSLWQGVNLPTQIIGNGNTSVTITQNKQQALLNWQTFNVGKQTKVTFDQTAGGENARQWIAFNKISDPTGVPSQILGAIEAIGQVYLLNQNGIIFGGSSQINLHTLVASSLPINDNLVSRGLLNNPDLQFLFSSREIPVLPNGGTMPAFTPPAPPNTADGKIGAVVVQPGAQLTSPTTADHVGGRIALIGPEVNNGGTISTPDGQTILAAGEQVALTAHPSSDPSLRGLDVFIGQVDAGRGLATNSGLIEAPRADVTIAGQSVEQRGAIDSSTSVSLNGRIDLLANYDAIQLVDPSRNVSLSPTASGLVSLGANSVTQVLPELESTERVVGTQLALRSQINLQGLALHLENNATILAPSAKVSLAAGSWLASPPGYSFVFDAGQVYLDAGATIDVSGSANVEASVTENIVDAQLRGAELANFPLQRNGPLRGQTIHVDIRDTGTYNGQTWIGTPLADVSGYVNLVQRTVGELTTAGGTVSINAGNSVVLQTGSGIDVSGGSIAYQGAFVQTTKVISGSNIFDISQATPDRIYTGIYNGSTTVHPKWGITETNSSGIINGGQFEPGYTQGASGGTLSITAPSMALDGALVGHTASGSHQRTAPPVASTLALAFQAQSTGAPPFIPISPTPPQIIFQSGRTFVAADPFALDASGNPQSLRADRLAQVILSPDLLTTGGFGNLKIDNSDGDISVPANVGLTSSPGGSIAFTGANIDLRGSIVAPGGTLSLTALDVSPTVLFGLDQMPVTPPPDPTRGHFSLGNTASLSTAGLITDQRQPSDASNLRPFAQNGGAITIAGFDVNLARGSALDVSGGAIVSAIGTTTYGNGGAITIKGGQDPSLPSLIGGSLDLGSTLLGYSGTRGGSLSILAPLIRIGATTESRALNLQPAFFSTGGFNSFALSAIGQATTTPGQYVPAIVIAPQITIAPVVENFLVNLDRKDLVTLDRIVRPLGVRGPINLSFDATGAVELTLTVGLPLVRGDLVMGEGALIRTDPSGSVSLRGQTAAILGSVIAPGGNITIAGGGNSANIFPDSARPLPTVDLGPRSLFSVAGTTVLTPNSLGFRTGRVLAGGNIIVGGNIAAERGSVLDVSGAAGVLDLAPGFSGTNTAIAPGDAPLIPTRVESNAGTITFNSSQELFLDSTLIAQPGGPSANGGSVVVNSDRFTAPGTSVPLTPLTTTLFVRQNGPTIPQEFYGAGENAIGHFITGTSTSGGANVSANSFANGIESVTLRTASGIGATEFDGPVSLAVGRQIVITGGAIFADADVSLNAPYVKLGTDFQAPLPPDQIANAFTVSGQPFYFPAQFGPGTFIASGKLIDLGNLSLQHIGSSNFIATNGDIRGDGTLNAAGAINLTAGQIYPTTGVRFTIAADDYQASGFTLPGLITIAQSATRRTPLSAGGELNIFASIIRQDGTLRAPIGTINLGVIDSPRLNPISNAPFAATRQLTLGGSSVHSVSADGLTIPYGVNQNGTAWIDPAGVDITVSGVPGKSIKVAAANVADVSGSTIDLCGGGDLLAYRFVSGNGGTRDILASNSSYAIVPGYEADFAPIDPGYANSTLSVADRVSLSASDALPAGVYTLLPARYALLPGAVLLTPKSGAPNGPSTQVADGSSVVSGYRFNDLNSARTGQPLNSLFEIAPAEVLKARAEYDLFSANTFLRAAALSHAAVPPRLPIDAGRLVLTASQTLTRQGAVLAQAPTGGRGGVVDISSPADILIGPAGGTAPEGMLFLDAAQLSSFGAESLLIGGLRSDTKDGTMVAVTTDNVTVDNSGSSLTSPELILVAHKNLTIAPDAQIEQRGTLAGSAETLLLGNEQIAGRGDGVLLRLTSDSTARIVRTGVDSSTVPTMVIGAGARLVGASLTLDSTYATRLDPAATLSAPAIALNSGQITLRLANSGAIRATAGLVLSDATLQNLTGLQSLSLLSYSSLDIFGTGQVGSSSVEMLALHAGEIRGFDNQGGAVVFAATNILLDNSPKGSAAAVFGGGLGTLQFNAENISLGKNQTHIDQFSNVILNASGAIVARDAGGLSTAGNLTLRTALLTGAAGSEETLSSTGALTVEASGISPASSFASGLGARLNLEGSRIAQNSAIVLPSGAVTLHATLGDVSLGGTIDVAGIAQNFFDLTKYTSGGEVTLTSDRGNVSLLTGSSVKLGAASGGGDAGRLSINLPAGGFTLAGTLSGAGGAGGTNASFSLDVGQLSKLGALNQILDAASFNKARVFRVRTGDVLVDGLATTRLFDLSADEGSINVTGTIDSSGATGGTIALRAAESLTLAAGSRLSVAAQNFDAAGKGGSISLEAGSETNGNVSNTASLNLATGSTIDLSVAANATASLGLGQLTGTLHLRAPQTTAGDDLQIAPINSNVIGASSIVVEGYHLFDLTGTDGSLTSAVQEAVRTNGETFGAADSAIRARLLANNSALSPLTVIAPGAEIIDRSGDLSLGSAHSDSSSDWDLSIEFSLRTKRRAWRADTPRCRQYRFLQRA
ncbi:MAG: filamentous hemagglutinin N-terminal domain-containing protein [Chthoniobacterales bacterium]